MQNNPPLGVVLDGPLLGVLKDNPLLGVLKDCPLVGVVKNNPLENIVDSPLVDIVVHNLLVSIVEVVIGNRILEKARMGGHPLLMGRFNLLTLHDAHLNFTIPAVRL